MAAAGQNAPAAFLRILKFETEIGNSIPDHVSRTDIVPPDHSPRNDCQPSINLIAVAANGLPVAVMWPALASSAEILRNDRRPAFGERSPLWAKAEHDISHRRYEDNHPAAPKDQPHGIAGIVPHSRLMVLWLTL
jgi:hypothetical protein